MRSHPTSLHALSLALVLSCWTFTAYSGDEGSDKSGAVDASATVDSAKLVIPDQTLAKPFTSVTIKLAQLPEAASKAGKVRVLFKGGDDDGKEAGSVALPTGKAAEDLILELSKRAVATQAFVGQVVDHLGKPQPGTDGEPLQVDFSVVGDNENPELFMPTQDLDPKDRYTLKVGRVVVPARFKVGAWVAVYTDKDGKPDKLRGKAKFKVGEHKDAVLKMTKKLTKGQPLHALLKEGMPGSGGWSSTKVKQIVDFAGNDIAAVFKADCVAFHPVLEIEDQELTNNKEMKVKKVTVPTEHFGGWLAIYSDKAGKQGDLLGKLYFTRGTKTDKTLKLNTPVQGDQTLHAVLYAGQKWDEKNNVVMVAPGGGEMTMQFKVGAKSLSYIIANPTTTKDPRHVVVTRAYSYDKPAWVVLARDDNGKPGTVIAQKKILKRFAGNVHLNSLYGDFLTSGSTADYLTGKPGTYRRSVRGNEKLHVLLYEDDPQDSKFTWTPGGIEDKPVLDAQGVPVTAMVDVTVKASIDNSQKYSSRYYSPCPLSQHVGNATLLPVDCRCHTDVVGLDFPECKALIADHLKMNFGEGPRARTQNHGGFRSGYSEPETNELIGLIVWKDHKTKWPENKITIDVGAVVAIDADTRNRRIISGRYDDPTKGIIDIGKGPVLSYPFEVQKGPDGKIYVGSYGFVRIGASLRPTIDIIRVDPKTGDREYVWRSNHLGFNFEKKTNPYGHCGNGRTEKFGNYTVQIGRKAFGIDEKGNFYLSYAHNGYTPTSDGIGILQISADGKACNFVTRTKVGKDNVLYKGESIGKGPEPQAGPYKGMLVKDGKLYVSTQLNAELWEVDIATGDRKALHIDGVTDPHSASSGTHVLWDKYRNLIWQAGLSGSTLLFDPEVGKAEPLWCPQNYRDFKGIGCVHLGAWGANGMPLERGLWLHPNSDKYAFVVNASMIIRVHLESGTSEIFSY
jgi:hypothetical protein